MPENESGLAITDYHHRKQTDRKQQHDNERQLPIRNQQEREDRHDRNWIGHAMLDAMADAILKHQGIAVDPRNHVTDLRLIEIVDEIPKSASGKILRRVLRDKYDTA